MVLAVERKLLFEITGHSDKNKLNVGGDWGESQTLFILRDVMLDAGWNTYYRGPFEFVRVVGLEVTRPLPPTADINHAEDSNARDCVAKQH